MKKNAIKYTLAIYALLGLIANAASLPIRDQAELREYALGQVVRGFRSVSGDSLVSQGSPTWVDKKGVGAEQVLDALLATKLEYGLENPLDEVIGRIWLYDKDENLIFFGQAVYTKEVFGVGGAGPQYSLWMQDIPLLTGVVSAEILAIGEDGITANRESLDVAGGHVLFRPYLAGIKNGLLSVRYDDDSIVIYDLSDPVGRSATDLAEATMAWKISGHHVIAPTSGAVLQVDITEAWENPTALIEVKPGQTVSVNVSGLVQDGGGVYFEHPGAMVYTQVDGPSTGSVSLNTTTMVSLSPGKYRLRFNGWKKFAQPGMLYTGPIDDGNGGPVGIGSSEPSPL